MENAAMQCHAYIHSRIKEILFLPIYALCVYTVCNVSTLFLKNVLSVSWKLLFSYFLEDTEMKSA